MTTDITPEAIRFATDAHRGQIHRDGQPAIVHSLGVAERFTDEPEMYAIAVLHDVVEDCPQIIPLDIRTKFGDRVFSGVMALSRRDGESWRDYIARVRANPDAIRVKISDIEYNIGRADDQFLRKLDMYNDTLAQLRELQLLQFPTR